MKIGIVGAGDCSVLDRSLEYIAVDNGLCCLLSQHIEPKFIVGDFDSLEDRSLIDKYQAIALPQVKNDTDLHVALQEAIARGYSTIYLYGVTGGRLDHFLSVLNLLYRYSNYNIIIKDDQNLIYYGNDCFNTLENTGYKYFSLFSFEDNLVTVNNAKYPLVDYLLTIGDTLCVSNEPLDGVVEIVSSKGLYIILSNDKKGLLASC
ncbi:MAG: thiamine diphosphokinase [Erysipelotrichaceae bacterium]|nr:thiamine diphosphokinase [Erysipelotrichaceae bacterium]MDD3809553.1 thiamine diphosphokinase [Erysipelotrichaceae bacterium]